MRKFLIILIASSLLFAKAAYANIEEDEDILILSFPNLEGVYLLVFDEEIDPNSLNDLSNFKMSNDEEPILAIMVPETQNLVILMFSGKLVEGELNIDFVDKLLSDGIYKVKKKKTLPIDKVIVSGITNQETESSQSSQDSSSSADEDSQGKSTQETASEEATANSETSEPTNESSNSTENNESNESNTNNTQNANSSTTDSTETSSNSSGSSSASNSSGGTSSIDEVLDKVISSGVLSQETISSLSDESYDIGIKFNDIHEHFAYKAIIELFVRNVVSGYNEETFGPNNGLTRAQAAKVLLKAFYPDVDEYIEVEVFPDVDLDKWYAGFIAEGFYQGFIQGYEDGSFKPNKAVTRAEFLSMLLQVSSLGVSGNLKNPFNDLSENEWFTEPILEAYALGLIQGYGDGNVGPHNTTSRGEAAVIIVNAMKLVK